MSIESEIALMQQSSMFQEVEPARLRLLAMSGDHIHFDAGDVMIRKGDPGTEVLFILKGRVRTSFDFELQSLVGYVAVFLNTKHSVTIVADTQVEALRISASDFLEMLAHCNQTALAVMRELARIVQAISLARPPDPHMLPSGAQASRGVFDVVDHD